MNYFTFITRENGNFLHSCIIKRKFVFSLINNNLILPSNYNYNSSWDCRILKVNNFNEKEVLVNEFINSGINITPYTLNIISTLDNPLNIVRLIIKNVSFLPNFKGHLTLDILKEISDKEITKSLHRTLFKETSLLIDQEEEQKEPKDERITRSFNKKKPIEENQIKPKIKENSIKNEVHTISQEESFLQNTNFDNLHITEQVKKNNIYGRSKTTLEFTPIAKDYDLSYEILKDPSGKLYTDGSYQEFYELTLDKFNKLRKLMRKRPEVLSANNINNILRLTNKVEVSVIGLVKMIRKTKNGNFFLVLEDITGLINVIIRKDLENQDIIKVVERTLNDQMVYVEGLYNPGERGKSGIIFCNYLSKIDIPKDFEPNKAHDPLSVALISDIHIGSKEFEEKLWKRFIDLINGKIGNKNQKERAGRIKYIIINGDLVDGIGVYPGQEKDLVFTDIYKQFSEAAKLLSEIPDYIKIIYSSGNHDPVRIAIPRPAVPNKYASELIDIGVSCIGNPSVVQTHNIKTLIYHGDSILDINMLIPGLENNKPVETMKELLKCRHLAPVYGKKTQIAPLSKDWLVINKIPDIFHTGHLHINGMDHYNNIALVNSGTFQNQTSFMKSLGIQPTPGILSLIELDTLQGIQIDLKSSI